VNVICATIAAVSRKLAPVAFSEPIKPRILGKDSFLTGPSHPHDISLFSK
jgi:hypothetical protein